MSADEDLRVVDGFFVTHPVRHDDPCGNDAMLKVELLVMKFSPDDDHCFWFVGAVTAVVEAVRAADGRGQIVLWTIE